MSVKRSRRRKNAVLTNLRKRGTFESLEARLLLAADSGVWGGIGGGLSVDIESIDTSRVLVRYADGATDTPQGLADERDFSLVSGLHTFTIPHGQDYASTVALLDADPAIAYVEPNYRVTIATTPDDARFSELWGMHNTGQSGGTVDADIDMTEAWELSVGTGSTVVAVIDTGVDYNHVDLQDNIWRNADEVAGDGIDNDGNGYIDDIHGYDFHNNDPDPIDDHNHGTHVAGTIAGVGNNGIGVAGVNWNTKIMALKFLDSSGGGTIADAIDALEYAVANGATVSNNSWGFHQDAASAALREAILASQDQDHLFAAAAGNGNWIGIGQDNENIPFFPASYDLDNIISVAASDHNDQRAIFSNFGATSVDVAAPGVNILSTTRGNTYSFFQGTSMATPLVTGLAASLRDTQPGWTYHQTINQILNTVDPLPAFQGITVTGGRINALTALQGALNPAPEIVVTTSEGTGIADDTGILALPNTAPGLPFVQTVMVRNIGTEPLQLIEPISVPAGYTLASTFGQTLLQSGEMTSFELQIDAAVEDTFTGEVSFGTNDADEDPFNFTVTGTVVIPPAVQILDNGDANFATAGEWNRWGGQGYQNDIHESMPGSGADVASWTFRGQLPGLYRVAATWYAFWNRASNSPFTIWDDETMVHSTSVNQQLSPDDFADSGAQWEELSGLLTINSGVLTVTLNDNADGNLNADAIRIQRVDDDPEIVVTTDGNDLEDGVSEVDFGTTAPDVPLPKVFTVTNVGIQPLTLDSVIAVPTGFQLVTGFGQTTLQPSESTTFEVALMAQTIDSYEGQISFGNNDGDEDPFDFTVRGTVDPPPPPVRIVDNGDAGFSATGWWTQWGGQGYQNDIHESSRGDGGNVATWIFEDLLPGTYRVAATWTAFSNRATNSPFTIWHADTLVENVEVNQQLVPSDFVDAGVQWEQLGGLHTIGGGTLSVTLNNDADGNLNADAIRVERLENAPEIEVTADGSGLVDGVSVVDFGATAQTVPANKVFTVENVGLQPLSLNPVISVPAGFQLVSGFAQPTLQPSESTTFEIELVASTVDNFTGQVSFGNNDGDENPFDFTIQGTVTPPPPPVQIIDNGDTGFSTVGAWARWGGQGYQNDVDESYPGSGGDVATWTFSGLLPGTYRVAATWAEFSNRATNSPFMILDGDTQVDNVLVNQQLAPNDFADSGVDWEQLGGLQSIAGGVLSVTLNDAADGRLNADAIRIERLENAPEIEVAADGSGIVDGVTDVDFGVTSETVPVSKVFTVTNVGIQPLTLNSVINVPTGFQLVSGFGQTMLQPSESTTFEVELVAATVDSYSGLISFGNNDGDENPFDFTVQGTVNPPPPSVQIIDNGDPGFSTVGGWTRWGGQGYQNDIHESLPGSGGDVATWTFTGLLPGTYRVAATWFAFSNRASNSPFAVWDDGTLLENVQVNQKVAPDDFPDVGTNWEQLGGLHTISSGILSVTMNDNADGRLNADAIRIEKMAGATSSGAATSPTSPNSYEVFWVPVPPAAAASYPIEAWSVNDSKPTTNIVLPLRGAAVQTATRRESSDRVFAGWNAGRLDGSLLELLAANRGNSGKPLNTPLGQDDGGLD